MSAGTYALIGLLGGLGAVARVLVGTAVVRRAGTALPLGTLAVNLSGALGAGLTLGLIGPGREALIVLAGVFASFTTFSTWIVETDRLARGGRRPAALLNLIGPTALGLLLAWGGLALGRAL